MSKTNGSLLKIERGIPVPRGRGNALKYPYEFMKVGESFFVPSDNPSSAQQLAMNKANRYRRENKMKPKFTSRTEAKGVRVWRIE